MSIYIARFRESGDTSYELMSLMSDNREMRFQVPLKLSDSMDWSRDATNQEVSSKSTDRQMRNPAGAKCAATKPRDIQFATVGQTEILAAGNFGDWHQAVGEVPWSSVPKTPMNSHAKLVLHPLWNISQCRSSRNNRERPRSCFWCYECVFICLNDCLAYLLCIVYFRDIN